MREWNLSDRPALQLTIAADGMLTGLDYANDHIWELDLSAGDPPALALQTSFGLRARSLQLFPQFQSGDSTLSDPLLFFQPPVITRLYPNFIALRFSPFQGIEVIHEIWAAASQVVSGRFTFNNQNADPVDFNFEWIGVLNHLGPQGRSLALSQIGVNHVLTGASEELQPVCFMTGGPAPNGGLLPSLALKIELPPGGARQITWALAALSDAQASYELARNTTAREWEAEKARIELFNASRQVEIQTGNPDWDAALAVSQKAAASLVFSPGGALPNPSFVLARMPENGNSLRGDGSDYTHLWNGQTVLDAWYLSSILLPGMEQFAAGLVENFLAVQQPNGAIDWKPGMAGQRSKRLAQPLLATLAWRVYELLEDSAWLEKIYPRLLSFVRCWFSPQHDGDQDGYPEWDHPYQIGLDAIPLYHPWQTGSQGVDPRAVESPALAAFLYRECRSLLQMAVILSRDGDQAWLQSTADHLRAQVESQWETEASIYTYRDAETHLSPSGARLFSGEGSGRWALEQTIDPAQRLLIRIRRAEEKTRQTHITIRGRTEQGEHVEELTPRQIRWLYDEGRYTTRRHYRRLDEIIIRHAPPGDICAVETLDFSTRDLSLLLPLWAGIPDPERAGQLVAETILAEFVQPYGLPVCPARLQDGLDESTRMVSLPWNQLIAEGLLAYGFRQEAARLIERLMQAVIYNLKTKQQVSAFYHAASGHGAGDNGALPGLAPVGLFLQALGLKQLTESKVIVEGFNPFPWPVNVQYRGIKIKFEACQTSIELPDGHLVAIDNPRRHVVKLP